uniref:EC3-1 protein n=1 Tax=Colletotrichum higginsianum TaxID=80884 RepID=I2G774_9PEZI|nr:EC3-1 protein [Colletotrichum higginsianum]
MYFTNIFVLLLALPFTTKPGCYALPANKHIGNPIQYVFSNLIGL